MMRRRRRRQPTPTGEEITWLRHADWASKYAGGRGMTLGMIAALYGVTESAVSRGVSRIEAVRRDAADALGDFA